jgi:glucose-1-phosphate adenylyltransferase
MMKRDSTLALILGGGQGQRLYPLTLYRSKPAVPLGGKYRLIDITISNCINSGMAKIYVLTQFNSASLNHHLALTYRFSAFSDGFVDVLAAEQTPGNKDWFQGTADAVRQVLVHIRELDPDNVLILSGDHLYRMDYRALLSQHQQTGADVTVSVVPTDEEHASSFGLLKTDEHGRIVEFSEKPKGEALPPMRVDTTRFGLSPEAAAERPYLASMGIYVFRYAALQQILENTDHVDFGHQVIPAAIGRYRMHGFLFDGYWEDIGTIKTFFQANLALADVVPRFNLFDAEAPIYTHSRFLPGTKLADCVVRNSIICDGSIVNRSVIEHSVIGIRARIEENARISDSLVMGADYYQTIEELEEDRRRGAPQIAIGEGSVIRHAIIDKNARIGANVQILNEAGIEDHDGQNYFIRDGIVVIPKNATVPDGTII